LLRQINLQEARQVIDKAMDAGVESVRPALMEWLSGQPV
jgi:hypothetical protein